MRGLLITLVMLMLFNTVTNTATTPLRYNPDQKLVLVTLDGFRWQELFRGADTSLIGNSNFARRDKLMPFLWNTVATAGQLVGNRDLGSRVNVANPYSLSYPGYNELLTGSIDPAIYANYKVNNRNKTWLEYLNESSVYRKKVASFASWELFPFILNSTPSNKALYEGSMHEEHPATREDAITYMECMKNIIGKKPSVIFLSFSGTDDAGHAGNYEQYLQKAHQADQYIKEVWNTLQSMTEYRNKTSLLITTDHGRGEGTNWGEHGMLIGGSSQTWYGLMGPSVIPLGEVGVNKQTYTKDLGKLALRLLTLR